MKTPIFVRSLSEKERATLQRRFHPAPFADAPSFFEGERSPTDRREPGLWAADGARRHPRLQRKGRGCSGCQIFASPANPRYFRRGKRRGFEGAFASFSERVWLGEEPVDALDGRRSRLRGEDNAEAGLRGEDPSDALAPSRSEVAAGEALDHLPRPFVREKKRRRDQLIGLAEPRPEWAVGFLDECWWSRVALPTLSSWSEEGKPERL